MTRSPTSFPFDLQRLRDVEFLRQIDFHWTVDSTNGVAAKMASVETTETPLLVLAETQTAGRGRGNHRWWSSEGSLTFSLLVDVDVDEKAIGQISLAVGLCVCRAVEQLIPSADVGLKWPNDVYLEGRKLAGILIELLSVNPRRAVIGVGVNVNNSVVGAPDGLDLTAISLSDIVGQEFNPCDVLLTCLREIERRWPLCRESIESLADQWRSYDILNGRRTVLDTYGRKVEGVCRGIDDAGAILLETADGLETFVGGTVIDFSR